MDEVGDTDYIFLHNSLRSLNEAYRISEEHPIVRLKIHFTIIEVKKYLQNLENRAFQNYRSFTPYCTLCNEPMGIIKRFSCSEGKHHWDFCPYHDQFFEKYHGMRCTMCSCYSELTINTLPAPSNIPTLICGYCNKSNNQSILHIKCNNNHNYTVCKECYYNLKDDFSICPACFVKTNAQWYEKTSDCPIAYEKYRKKVRKLEMTGEYNGFDEMRYPPKKRRKI